MRVALLRCEQGAGLACRLGRCFKAFHALRSPPETRTPLRCESRYSHKGNGVTTMCGHVFCLFYCLTNTPLKRGAVFCAARQILARPLGRVAERGEVGRGFPLFFLLFSARGRPKTSSASPSGCRKKSPAQTGKGTAKIRRLCYTIPDRKGRGKCAWRGMR